MKTNRTIRWGVALMTLGAVCAWAGDEGEAAKPEGKKCCGTEPAGCCKTVKDDAATPCAAGGEAKACAMGKEAKPCAMDAAAKPCAGGDEAVAAGAHRTVTTDQVAAMIEGKKPVVILDARAAKWDDGKRIPGAKALSAQSTDAEIATALPDKNAEVVAYCSNLKCPASAQLVKRLDELGYKNVSKYPDGIQGWLEAGKPVVEAEKAK
jgi:rhodanese-related sulfurtransferase